MKDTALHDLSLEMNRRPRFDVQGALQGVHRINLELARNHIIQESPSSQHNITETVFCKFTTVYEIIEKSATNASLNRFKLQKAAELQGFKDELKRRVASKDNDEIVNDVIGGK